jgi:hypothetical protein
MEKIVRKNSNKSIDNQNAASEPTTKKLGLNQHGIQLAIRTELFEHGIFPSLKNHGKITSSILVDTFTNLNLLSSIDYKIKLQSWIDQAVKHIPGMTANDA